MQTLQFLKDYFPDSLLSPSICFQCQCSLEPSGHINYSFNFDSSRPDRLKISLDMYLQEHDHSNIWLDDIKKWWCGTCYVRHMEDVKQTMQGASNAT